MKTKIVNLRSEAFDVYIGREGHGFDGYFGNPFRREGRSKADAIERYRIYFAQRVENDPEFKSRVLELRGKRLGCFCRQPGPCHGTVILAYLEQFEEEQEDWLALVELE